MLKARPRSEHEARSRLAARGFAEREVEATIGLAKDAGLIDDRVFARLWIEDRILHHPLARDAVARELREKGVPEAIATSALVEFYPEHLEKELVWKLARERYERLAGVEEEKRDRRTLSFLTRRGFRFGVSREIVRRLAKGDFDE